MEGRGAMDEGMDSEYQDLVRAIDQAQGIVSMEGPGFGVPLHMEYLNHTPDFGNLGMNMGTRLTQIQPISYLPPWHLTNGDIRFQSNTLSFNGFGNPGTQYAAVAQQRPYFPAYGAYAAGFSGNPDPLPGPFFDFKPPNHPTPFPSRNPGMSIDTAQTDLGPDSMNWRSAGNNNGSSSGSSGQTGSQSQSQAQDHMSRQRNPGRKRNGPNRNNWRSQSEGDTADESSDLIRTSRQALLQEQIAKFPHIPFETHKKIQQMYGNRIVEYFDVGLVLFKNETIVDTQKCHVIFTTKAETGQYWLMAFAKKSRAGRLMKFNRLLTPHLKVTTTGKTAVELAPSKASPHDGEQFVFSFASEPEAAKFLEILNTLRNKLWNHDELRQASARNNSNAPSVSTEQAIAGTSSDTGSMSDAAPGTLPMTSGGQKETNSKKRVKLGKPRRLNGMLGESIWGPTPRSTLFHDFRMDGPWKLNEEMAEPKVPVVIFTLSNATLFVKTRTDFTLLGVGTLKIVSGRIAYHELEFFGPRDELICSHNIYTWNKMNLTPANNGIKWICAWTAAANLLNTPRTYPTSHEFKLEVEDQGAALGLQTAFSESAEIATLVRPSGATNTNSSTATSITDETQDIST